MFRDPDTASGGSGVRRNAAVAALSWEQIEDLPTGPELAALLFATDPTSLTPDAQVSFVVACQHLLNAVSARQDAGLVAFAGANPRDTVFFVDGNEHALTDARALELQCALAWSEGHTRTRIAHARTLASRLPECSAVIANGSVQPLVMRAIAEGAETLTASIDEAIAIAVQTRAIPADIEQLRAVRRDLLATFDTCVASFAPGRSVKAVGKKVREIIARLDPKGVAARRAKAIRTQSDVRVAPLADGMAMLTAILPTEQAHACLRVIDTAARNASVLDAADPIGLRRTRALFHLVTRAAAAPSGMGLPVHLDVVVSLDAFLGLNDDAGVMPGAGSVPAHAARQLLADAAFVKIRRILTDPRSGHALDVGVRRYTLTDAERERIALRDRTCRMIDCNAPAYRCECDHATSYADGGATNAANLGMLCKRHHQHKTHAGWQIIDSQPDGSCVWVSPLGRRYRHDPEPVLPSGAETKILGPHDSGPTAAALHEPGQPPELEDPPF